MPIVHPCSAPGCSTLTMGVLCLEHELEGAAALADELAGEGERGREPQPAAVEP